jgi:hypothetical protein
MLDSRYGCLGDAILVMVVQRNQCRIAGEGGTMNKMLAARLIFACLSMLAAIAVYLLLRIDAPMLFQPLQAADAVLSAPGVITGCAPSFLYTLAIGLCFGACAPSAMAARWHCVGWSVLALLLEFSQVPVVATAIGGALPSLLPAPASSLIAPYWEHGVFDWLDIVATVLGGGLALISIRYLPGRRKHESAH